jgi:hypothetical protein
MQIEESAFRKRRHAFDALVTLLDVTVKDLTTKHHLEASMSNTRFKYLRVDSRWLSISCCAALLLIAMKVNAQNAGTGNIQGTVTDATGAVVANANVTLTEVATGVTHKTKPDNAGLYVFPNIPITTYKLVVTAPGFETYEQTGIVLEVGSNIAINPSLSVGRTDIKIEVHSEGLALQNEDPTYKQTIDSTQITEMPLNGRQLTGLLQLSGGTTAPPSGNDFTGSKYSYQAVAISVAGGMGNSTLWRLDGGDNGDYMAGANLPFPFPDAVNQFSVESSTLGAQDGMHAGGMVNMVTRSGTNQFHGSGFEFIRNNIVDATNFYATGKDQLHQDQYGGTIGGPVWLPGLYNGRDRFFFFAGFQYTRSVSSSANTSAYVPTPANLAGDFHLTAPTPAAGPNLCSSKTTQLVDPLTGNIVPNNIYTTTPTWNPVSLALYKYLPKIVPLPDGSDQCGHVLYAIPNQNFDKQFITRMDYKIGLNDNLYGRYLLDSYQLPSFFFPTNILVTTQSGNPEQRVQTGTIGEDHLFSSNLVNSAHIALLRRLNHRGYNPADINPCTLGDSITCAVPVGLNLGTGGNGIGNATGGFNMGSSTDALAHFNDNTLAIDDDVTWVHGKHQFVFGGEYVHNQLNISNGFNSNGVFTFGTNYSSYGPYGSKTQAADNPEVGVTNVGDGALDFLEGTMTGFSQTKEQQNALRSTIPSLYVQDTFHSTKQLTLVFGLRWDPFYAPIDVFNRGETFSDSAYLANQHSTVYPNAPAGVSFYGDPGVPRAFTQSSPNQWDPNFGFSYDPIGDGKTVLRGGGEYIYDTPNTFTMQRNQQNPPFATSVGQSLNTYIPFANPWSVPNVIGGPGATNTASISTNPFPNGAAFVGKPTAATAIFPLNAQFIVPVSKFHPAAYLQWTASIQHEFPRGWQAQIQYIGSKGTHEEFGAPLDPVEYIPGVSTGVAGPTNCNKSINGTNYYLGEPGASPVPAAGANCSTNGNNAQRALLTLENPTQGVYFGGGTTSQFVSDTAFSTYQGMVLSVNHRLSSTFSLLANYTWSKCLDIEDNQGDISGVTVENPNNPRMDYGPCGFDFRNVGNVVIVAKSGFHFNNRAERLILNNWEVSGLSHMQSGQPFSVTLGGTDDSLTAIGNDRASLIPNVPVYKEVKFSSASGEANREYLNPAAFVLNPTTTLPTSPAPVYGNTGRNAFHGPPAVQFDCQVTRVFPIHERLNLTTRIEAFNVLNHPNFGTPNANVLSGTFGQVSGTNSATNLTNARVFQGVIKLTF